jgi:hypothetical protein
MSDRKYWKHVVSYWQKENKKDHCDRPCLGLEEIERRATLCFKEFILLAHKYGYQYGESILENPKEYSDTQKNVDSYILFTFDQRDDTRLYVYANITKQKLKPSDFIINMSNCVSEEHTNGSPYINLNKVSLVARKAFKEKNKREADLFIANVIMPFLKIVPQPSKIINIWKKPRQPSKRLRFEVLKRDGYKCILCGASPKENESTRLEIDHIVPFSKGGATRIDNLQVLCFACNRGKYNLDQYKSMTDDQLEELRAELEKYKNGLRVAIERWNPPHDEEKEEELCSYLN